MKTLIALTAAALLLASPAWALTAQQVQQQVGGYHCAGSTCTSRAPTTVTIHDRDTIGNFPSESNFRTDPGCRPGEYRPNGMNLCVHVEADTRGSSGAYVIPGATHADPACTTTTKVIGFDPAGGANGFSVSTSTGTAPGACAP